ncbi:MAG: UDP-2,4-diacetamido-2,4,6-trideoxy-beta-L-altropyranose hydrolase [Cycloclasticus sp.]
MVKSVIIRADASLQMGTGHIMRCLTLAEALKKQAVEIEFICRAHAGNLIERIKRQGFKIHVLPLSQNTVIDDGLYGSKWLGSTQQEDAELCLPILKKIKPDWLIVDHYSLDQTWQNLLAECFSKLMVIDDLANRKHQCDVLLDQTYGRKESDYVGLVPKRSQRLLGSEYALLRPEFAEWREYSLQRRIKPSFKKLLITMGGVDLNNVTGELLEVLKDGSLSKELEINIVMGATAPHLKSVQQQAGLLAYKTNVMVNVSNMAEMMANADLAIGAAGATTWERCCLGLPTIQIILAENQRVAAANLASHGAVLTLNKDGLVNLQNIFFEIEIKKIRLETVSKNAGKITYGNGSTIVVRKLTQK